MRRFRKSQRSDGERRESFKKGGKEGEVLLSESHHGSWLQKSNGDRLRRFGI
jgi:hypothetical protein